MSEQIEKNDTDIYEFASLEKYSFKERLLIRLISNALFLLIYVIGKTVRFEKVQGWKESDIEGYENFDTVYEQEIPSIIAYWHNRIFLMTYFWRKYDGATLSSQSFDGEYTARVAQKLGYGVIRGSTSRGGAKALKRMVKLSKKGTRMTFTVDGPRGPRYKAQSGVVHFAKRSNLPIIAVLIEAKNFWTTNSWDKLQIPKPFTKAKVFISEPVFVAKTANKRQLDEKQKELQTKLDELVEIGKQWRNSSK